MELESRISAYAMEGRIALCQSNIDVLITVGTQKHEALETYKKRLMQQLFPFPEEVAP